MAGLALELAAIVAALLVGGIGGFALGRSAILRRRHFPTNVQAIAGKRVKVVTGAAEGAEAVVLLTGEHWKARSVSGALSPGEDARVVALDGLCLLVLPERGVP
jgi:membrane-bound ClpP family serine protease